MEVHLTPELVRIAQSQVDIGAYSSIAEYIKALIEQDAYQRSFHQHVMAELLTMPEVASIIISERKPQLHPELDVKTWN